MEKPVTIKDLKNGDFFSPVLRPNRIYQIKNKYGFTTSSNTSHRDFDRYAVCVIANTDKIRSFRHDILVYKREI